MSEERRQATRFAMAESVKVEVIGQREQPIHPALGKVYERVTPTADMIGKTLDASSDSVAITCPRYIISLCTRQF